MAATAPALLKAVTTAIDALTVANSMMPLIQAHLNGTAEVTDESLAAAFAEKDAAWKRLGDLIA